MAEDNKEIPQLNVTAKWLDNIFERIAKITNIERVCRSGMPSDEKDLIIFDDEQVAEYQSRMLNLLIDEIEMLLPDVKRKLRSEDYKKISLKMKIIEVKAKDPFIHGITDYVSHTGTQYHLTPTYNFILRNLCLVRADIVEVLSPLLYGETETANDRRSIR